jgi:hypothetical protein
MIWEEAAVEYFQVLFPRDAEYYHEASGHDNQ